MLRPGVYKGLVAHVLYDKLISRDVAGLSSVFNREIWAGNPEMEEGTKLQGSLPLLCTPLFRKLYLAEILMS